MQAQQLTNLPTFYINTENKRSITDKINWIPGNITVESSDDTEILDMATEIRGRGNSTWNMQKKPYRIKLDKKTNLLHLPAREKDWVLLANYADKTLMRNAVAFKISELIGLEFSPSVRFVDLVLNGEYLGNYLLTDQIEVADFRVPVSKQDTLDTTLPAISGGYLLEVDGFADGEPVWFTTNKALKITVKYPKDDEINTQQLNYIKKFTQDFENVLFSDNWKNPDTGYRQWVDTTSLINWYIGCELTGNSDSFWSIYIYKKKDMDKFFFSPMWDYDIAFNNDNRLGDATLKLMRENAHNPKTWIQRLWMDDWFKSAVNRRWIELINEQNLLEQVLEYIDDTSVLINASQQKNFTKWQILNRRVYLEQFLFSTYQQGVDYLKTYLTKRVNFLTGSFASFKPEEPSTPFVAENFYYRIQNKGTNNAIDVSDESVNPQAQLLMWTPKEEDYGQQWQIKEIRDKIYQIINRNSGLAMTGNGRVQNLIQQSVDANNTAQQWKITAVFTGNIYGLENVKSGYSANNSGGGFDNGTPVIEYDNNIWLAEKVNQHWYIQKVEAINGSVDIRPVTDKPAFRIYPNPAREQVFIESDIISDLPVTIYDITGKCVYSATIEKNGTGDFEIPVRKLSIRPGIYIVKSGHYSGKLVIANE
jgi:hypothetical protein